MRGQLLKINEERAELISLENRMELPVDGKGQNGPLFWMHLEHSSSEEWEDILTMLKLSSDDKACAMQTRHFPHAAGLSAGGIVLRMPLRIPGKGISANAIQYLTVVMLPRLLISRIQGQALVLEKAGKRLQEDEHPVITCSAELFLYLQETILEMEINNLLIARNGVEHLASAAETDLNKLDARKLARFRRRVGHLAGQVEEKLFCLTLLASLLARDRTFGPMRSGITEQIDAHNHLLRSLQRVQERINELMQLADSHSRERAEQRLRGLTIISGVFMPLTFITGFYGMNFPRMPFMESEWGFRFIVCGMLGLGIGLLVFFRKRGWFN